MRFRKKPVEVEAVQYTGSPDNLHELAEFTGHLGIEIRIRTVNGVEPRFMVQTLEGNMNGQLGDWIIRGIKGEFYPCARDIFEATYEELDHELPIEVIKTDSFNNPDNFGRVYRMLCRQGDRYLNATVSDRALCMEFGRDFSPEQVKEHLYQKLVDRFRAKKA